MPSERPHRDDDPASAAPLLVCLHFLGGSGREWQGVAERLSHFVRVMTVDLPGFGDAAGVEAFSVAAMADHVAAAVEAAAPRRWALMGHSMGAKVAAAVARRAEDGESGLAGLGHLVLVGGSPPGPEPMEDDKRQEMLGWFLGDDASRRREAERYIDSNTQAPLPPPWRERAVDDVLRLDRAAWVAWLEHGSREDWRERIGVLATPTLVVAGSSDGALGPAAQRDAMTPHFADIVHETLPDAAHLMPMETPAALARLVLAHLMPERLRGLDTDYRALLFSDRVSSGTRRVLLERAAPDREAAPLPPDTMTLLRAALECIVPPATWPAGMDLAARMAKAITGGSGDGWRFDRLPPDADAYPAALATLDRAARARHGEDFAALDIERRTALLSAFASQDCAQEAWVSAGPFTSDQMKLWIEAMRGGAVRTFLSHPASLARMGYSGIGCAGDGPDKRGFALIGEGQHNGWEPAAKGWA